ncbi:vWA domain-containing protein [Clostridium algidicarnis]|uniref:vWA domain-containing protein n=1 Tax=Clostridium algidicarnis TaxID=37659 RepID=UPI001C0D7091|nr:VWA domain-containing protein [Clostridium algidicarnis]MBU3227700.1 VWA domain-containing protein [Clostridium algidicarnis]MBU3250893.1 VWA domain-containing protein [Clostridium algidicarnis]
MKIVNSWPLIFLTFIPLLIFLYLLKQKSQDHIIPSTFLWKEVYKNIEVSTPFERLKYNIMLLLQLLTILFLIFALTDPFLSMMGSDYKNIIIVMDSTGSMTANYDDVTRIEEAKRRAEEYIDSINTDAEVTIINAAEKPSIELSSSKDKSLAKDKVKSIKIKSVSGNIGDSLSIIRALAKENESYEAIFFTDKALDIEGINGKVVDLTQKSSNASLDFLSYSENKEELKVLVKVTNRGSYEYTSDVALYGDEKLLDIKSITLNQKESKNVLFDKISFKGDILKAELTEEDSIKEDNFIFEKVLNEDKKKVLLVTEKNIFLERALQTIPSIDIYKTNEESNINKEDKYDLYIFDNITPTNIPKGGNLLLINPESNSIFNVKEELQGGDGVVTKSSLSNYIEGLKFAIKSYKEIEKPNWSEEFLRVEEDSLGFIGNYNGKVVGVLGFDLHNSDLTLKAEFPILIHNVVGRLLDNGMLDKYSFKSGEEVQINARVDGEAVKIINPKGEEEIIDLRFPLKPYRGTDIIGIYEVAQKIDEESIKTSFTVNFPTDSESNIEEENKSIDNLKENKSIKGGLNLRVYLIILSLIIIFIEWILYLKGY